MMAAAQRTLKRYEVGGLPLIHSLAQRMGLSALLERFVASHGNDQVPVVDTLMLLIYNLTCGKEPLYQLPAWVDAIDGRAIGNAALTAKRFSDDRFARALDRLYRADRAALMTELVITVVELFELDLRQTRRGPHLPECRAVQRHVRAGKYSARAEYSDEERHS